MIWLESRVSTSVYGSQRNPVARYEPRLRNRVEVTQDTMAFHFETPIGFDFKPGQSVSITLMIPLENPVQLPNTLVDWRIQGKGMLQRESVRRDSRWAVYEAGAVPTGYDSI